MAFYSIFPTIQNMTNILYIIAPSPSLLLTRRGDEDFVGRRRLSLVIPGRHGDAIFRLRLQSGQLELDASVGRRHQRRLGHRHFPLIEADEEGLRQSAVEARTPRQQHRRTGSRGRRMTAAAVEADAVDAVAAHDGVG